MAGKGLFKMKRQMGRESQALSAAGSKQSAWSKLGMGLGGIAAMALTGGAATPLVAAMMAGGGTLAGGLLGRQGAKKGWFGTDKAKMKGGRFYRDEADKWKGEIGQSIWSGAAKAGLTAGMTKLGSGLSYGKEGLKAAIPGKSVSVGAGGVKATGEGFKMADIVKRGAETATYSDSLMGKLGKAIDIKGSLAAKGLGKIQSWQTGRELQGMGEASLGGGPSFAEGTGTSIKESLAQGPPAPWEADKIPSRRHAQFAPGEMTAKMREPGSGLTFDDPGQYARRAELEALYSTPSGKEPLGANLGWRQAADRGEISQYDEFGSFTGGAQHRGTGSGQSVAQERGDAFYAEYGDDVQFNKQGYPIPKRPNVPLDVGEDTYDNVDDIFQGKLKDFTDDFDGSNLPQDSGLWDSPPSRGAESIPEGFRGGPRGDIRLKDKDLGSSLLERARGEVSTRPTLNMQTGDHWKGRVLEPLSEGVAGPVIGTGQGVDQDIMGALMEGYNTPTGQGYDPGDEIFRQENRGAFMDELALEKGLDSRLGRTFGLPSTTRGYDFGSVAGKRHRDTLDSVRWHDRLFPNQ